MSDAPGVGQPVPVTHVPTAGGMPANAGSRPPGKRRDDVQSELREFIASVDRDLEHLPAGL